MASVATRNKFLSSFRPPKKGMVLTTEEREAGRRDSACVVHHTLAYFLLRLRFVWTLKSSTMKEREARASAASPMVGKARPVGANAHRAGGDGYGFLAISSPKAAGEGASQIPLHPARLKYFNRELKEREKPRAWAHPPHLLTFLSCW